MSTAYITLTLFARHRRPAAASRRRALVRLTLMLARDEQVRPRPPITLPGPPRADNADNACAPTKSGIWPATAISPPPTPIPRVRDNGESGRRADRFEKAKARESEPGDQRNGNWTREQLERMNARFCRRLTWAISRGLEQTP